MKAKLTQIIKRIAYYPTRAETTMFADTILQQMAAMVPVEEAIMLVMPRKHGKGILLGYNAEQLKAFTDSQLTMILCHETQHLRTGDLGKLALWAEPRDWYNGWAGQMLFNVARDCQINDMLLAVGMAAIEGGWYGTKALDRDTQRDDVEALMREIAEKFPKPPNDADAMADLSAEELEAIDQMLGPIIEVAEKFFKPEDVPGHDTGKGHGKQYSVSPSGEQARFDNFLAEIMDTKKTQESWYRTQKRLNGIPEFANREYALPFRTPLPRKTALLAIDVSGSIDRRGVERFCNLVRNTPSSFELEVVCFDTQLAVWEDFRTNSTLPFQGGGTDFDLVETHARKSGRYPNAVVVITDGQAAIPTLRAPSVWTWVIYNSHESVLAEFRKHNLRTVDLEAIIKR